MKGKTVRFSCKSERRVLQAWNVSHGKALGTTQGSNQFITAFSGNVLCSSPTSVLKTIGVQLLVKKLKPIFSKEDELQFVLDLLCLSARLAVRSVV